MKKTLTFIALAVALVLGIALPGAVFADVDAVETYIHIEKYVSVDGGTTWLEADVAPGPTATVGQEVKFKVKVTNGSVSGYTHENITVTDSDPGIVFTGVATILLPGEWDESDVVTVTALAGQHYNEATVTADPICGRVTDSNGAYYFGEEECGGEGLTPGYWKNHLEAWVGYEPTDSFHSIFGVGPDSSLLDVLNTGGGKFIALNRHAVAALLNVSSPSVDYPYTEAEVIAMVQHAYATGDWSSAKGNLEDANELGDS